MLAFGRYRPLLEPSVKETCVWWKKQTTQSRDTKLFCMYKKEKRKIEERVGGRKSRKNEWLPNKSSRNGTKIRWAEADRRDNDEKLPAKADREADSAWPILRPSLHLA